MPAQQNAGTHSESADALDVWSADFPNVCRSHGLSLRDLAPGEAEISEAFAAHFIIAVLRESAWLRWRFPRALVDGVDGPFARWLLARGAARYKFSSAALRKIRGAFRRSPGRRIYEIYLQDRELQRLYPLGLVPAGQRHFLGWLTTHGRTDQKLEDHEILWFLHEAAQAIAQGVALCYAVNPEWQRDFPQALAGADWQAFCRSLESQYPLLRQSLRQLKFTPEIARRLSSRPAGPGVNILSHFCYPSGIQQAALWTKAALEKANQGTSCRDVPAGIPTTLAPRSEWLGLEIYPITVITVAPAPYFATAYERSGWFRKPGIYRIAYWAWELETIPEEWLQLVPLLDEIWCPTEFVAQAMRTRFHLPVYRMLPGVEIRNTAPVQKTSLGIPEDHFVFLFMFDMYSDFERKNPLALIRAFRRAFGRHEPATLLLKTSAACPDPELFKRLASVAEENGVLLVRELLSREQAYGYLAMCDCYVSLHRSEGFGLGMAEAMLLGKPVIATGYSGNMDFMSPANSLLVDFERVPVTNSGTLYKSNSFWAEPSEEHAALLMRKVFNDRKAAAELGCEARRDLETSLSLEAAGRRMAARISQISNS